MNRLAQQIKAERLKAKMTEKELAQKCGLQVSYILQVESGKKVVNEQMATKILGVLNSKMESMSEAVVKEENEKVLTQKAKAPAPKPYKSDFKPTNQWADALSNIVKRVPIYNQLDWKEIGYREYPVIDGKVLGYAGDKLFIVKLGKITAPQTRCLRGDEVLALQATDFQNNKYYIVEYQGSKQMALLNRVSPQKMTLNHTEVDAKAITILGKCLSVQFEL